VERALVGITQEILERNQGMKEMVSVGIRTGRVYLAERFRDKIERLEGIRVPCGFIDIDLYRDDFAVGLPRPLVGKRRSPFPEDKKVSLVDDVLFTGRTARAARDARIGFCRPRFTHLDVLIDRARRKFDRV
jgi:pyrimidine operon attenuation protein / uracil phosphoribosyltransferase